MLVDFLVEMFNLPECIVLFGSFAKGEDVENSDIDLFILTSHKVRNQEELNKTLLAYEKELHRTINLHILSSLKKSSEEFKNALANGIVLYGYLKVV